ncbi:MAG: UTP--glucose-1-phosphate uridylyltransferase [Bifidobacteriaceae bacterium]|jgi:UTP--glucose-1-phosphate uridylyltransferase|nr:UTP--glucose-1-phosphate uridylyltransferase [Bifidobacteriaceae bacterium]
MIKYSQALNACKEKMVGEKIDNLHINIFEKYFNKLVAGKNSGENIGYIKEEEIEPIKEVSNYENLTKKASVRKIAQSVIIKLNGGLATTMGLNQAKVLLPLKDNAQGESRNFLDYIVDSAKNIESCEGSLETAPLIFMNSFRTSSDTLNYLKKFKHLQEQKLPLDFLQSKEPKISAETFYPINWNENPSLEWCPPGHGDLFTCLLATGLLDELLNNDVHYAYISNADNLAAEFDARILDFLISNKLSFLSEVTKKTDADIKGGHIVKYQNRLVLREFSQISPDDEAEALNPEKHPFINVNSIWVNLDDLKSVLQEKNGFLDLPVIYNLKNVNPSDKTTPQVIQLETAMGAAIKAFDKVGLLEISRTRFKPVKNYDDLERLKKTL